MNKDPGIIPNGQRIPNGMLTDNYPRNMWWVAAHSRRGHRKAPGPLAAGDAGGPLPAGGRHACGTI